MFRRQGSGCSITSAGCFCLLLLASGCGAKRVGPSQPQPGQAVGNPDYSVLTQNHAKKDLRAQAKYLESISSTARANRFRQADEESDLLLSAETRMLAVRAQREPDNPDLQKEFARALIREKKLVRAFETLERLRTIPPQDVEVESGLAVVWQKLGSTPSALYHAQQAVLLERSPSNLALLGRIHLQRNDYGKALEVFEEALPAFPDNQALKLAMAQACSGLGRWDQAAIYYRQLLEINPDQRDARSGYATALVYLGDQQEALAQLQRIFPPGQARSALAARQVEAHLWQDARESLQEALRFSPGDAELMLRLSSVESRLPLPAVVSVRRKDGAGSRVLVGQPSAYRLIELENGLMVVEATPGDGSKGTPSNDHGNEADLFSEPSRDIRLDEAVSADDREVPQLVRRRIDPTVVELVEASSETESADALSGLSGVPAGPGRETAGKTGVLEASELPDAEFEDVSPALDPVPSSLEAAEGTMGLPGFLPVPDAAVFVSKLGVFPLEMPQTESSSEQERPKPQSIPRDDNAPPPVSDPALGPQVVKVFSAAWTEEPVPAGAPETGGEDIPGTSLEGRWPKVLPNQSPAGDRSSSGGRERIPDAIPESLPRRGVGDIELKLALPEVAPRHNPEAEGKGGKQDRERVIGAAARRFPPLC